MMMEQMDVSPNRCTAIVYYAWKIFTCLFLHVILVAMVVSYCIMGAILFEYLEKDFELLVRKDVTNLRAQVIEDLWKLTQDSDVLRQLNWTSDAKQLIKVFEDALVKAMRKNGWNGSDEDEDKNLQWTFAGALFYSIIVITTIGYGHIAPKTTWGKVATIFYAIVGIPLMLLCLSNIGDIMAHSFRFLYWKVCCYACTRPRKPPDFSRRTKSIRSHDGRMPVRSLSARPASFRRHVRTSTRSADCALGMGDGMHGRAAHSDTECGYYDEQDRDYQMRGVRSPRAHHPSNSNRPGAHWPRYADTPFSGGKRHQSRLAEHSRSNQNLRYSASAMPDSPRTRGGGDYNMQKYHRSPSRARHQEDEYELHHDPRDPLDDDGLPPTTPPVLYNKYALDRDESQRVNSMQAQQYRNRMRRAKTPIPEGRDRDLRDVEMGRRTRTLPSRNHLTVEMSPPISHRSRTRQRGGRSRLEEQSPHHTPSPRIMSPLGFAVHRQTYVKPRPVPPPVEFDYYPQDFDFFTEYYDTKAAPGGDQIKPVPIWLCVFLVISYIIGGAYLFSHWEPWGFPDSAYFCFITLTTIGFGDFVPAQNVVNSSSASDHQTEKTAELRIALCSLYLLFGIALLAMSFNLVQEEVISNVKAIARHLGIIKSSYDNEDE